jgi:hypothetical protein
MDGKHFYLKVFGGIIAVCILGFLFFSLMGWAWRSWGALAAIVVAMGATLGIAYVYDRMSMRNQ